MKILEKNGKKVEDLVRELYLENRYVKKIPNLHVFDTPWKLSKIFPLIDKFISYFEKRQINILDVGGGAGLILKGVSIYLKKKYNISVNKYALDLSPEILEILKIRNPDLKNALNEDIRKTSLDNKEIDLSLMIDVLEHIPKPQIALNELKRISNYVIFKVPLEDNLYYRIWNIIKKGERKKFVIENSGHINFYNFYSLKSQIEKKLGEILDYNFTNVFEFIKSTPKYRNNMNFKDILLNKIALLIYNVSPKLASLLFQDFVMILCKCSI
jgi:SAM-dependent methyltransferase